MHILYSEKWHLKTLWKKMYSGPSNVLAFFSHADHKILVARSIGIMNLFSSLTSNTFQIIGSALGILYFKHVL
jgi:hypothetical protein